MAVQGRYGDYDAFAGELGGLDLQETGPNQRTEVEGNLCIEFGKPQRLFLGSIDQLSSGTTVAALIPVEGFGRQVQSWLMLR